MMILYYQQLKYHIIKELNNIYLISGNDLFLLQDSKKLIYEVAASKGFHHSINIHVDAYSNWDNIYDHFRSFNLFHKYQIISIILPDTGITNKISNGLINLSQLLHKDIILILQIKKLIKLKDHKFWLQFFKKKITVVVCLTPNKVSLNNWIKQKAQDSGLDIDNQAVQQLSYYYEGNLVALSQILELLALIGCKKTLNCKYINKIITNSSNFTIYHWIDALLEGNSNRAIYVLQILINNGIEANLLIRFLQYDLLKLLQIKRLQLKNTLDSEINTKCILKYRQKLFIVACKRINLPLLKYVIHELMKIELSFKKDHNQFYWINLQKISLIITKPQLPINFLDI